MNFLIDANLPRRLVYLFRERGHQAITTKDSDFSTLFWLQNRPDKLLLISTGNIRNADLDGLLAANFDQLITGLTENRFVELTREHIIVHA